MSAAGDTRRLALPRRALLWLAVVGVALAGGRSVAVAVNWAQAMVRRAPSGPDAVTRFEQGLGAARALLAAERVVGYAFDAPNQKLLTVGYGEQTNRFQLAQYALAPAVVSRAGGRRWVFADFSTAEALRAYAAEHGYDIRWSDGGRGVLEAAQ